MLDLREKCFGFLVWLLLAALMMGVYKVFIFGQKGLEGLVFDKR